MTLKYGRKPPKQAPAIRLSSILSGDMPSYPAAVDYLNLGGWQMLGNDQYGDCVAVTWANMRRLMTHHAGAEKYPEMSAVAQFYKTQNPGFPTEDNGMDIQTALEYLVHSGGPDGVKPLAFAKVDYYNETEVKAALAIFGALWVGVNVSSDNETQFRNGQPWDYNQHAQNEGGHSIIVGGYDSDGRGGDEKFITWATETSFTDAFWEHQVEEAWVVIWPELISNSAFMEGVDQNKLADAYLAVTGRPFPVVTPTPVPTPPVPVPAPTPVDTDGALLGVASSWLSKSRHTAAQTEAFKTALGNWVKAHSEGGIA